MVVITQIGSNNVCRLPALCRVLCERWGIWHQKQISETQPLAGEAYNRAWEASVKTAHDPEISLDAEKW